MRCWLRLGGHEWMACVCNRCQKTRHSWNQGNVVEEHERAIPGLGHYGADTPTELVTTYEETCSRCRESRLRQIP